jgi:ABC-type branched-subunit amino acid transport system substrate-binding protein
MRKRWQVLVGLMLVMALIAAACGDDDDATTTEAAADTTTTTAAAETTTTAAAETTTTAAAETTTTAAGLDVDFDVGVTAEPCPGSPNPENGCIYLGVITDLTGPFALFGNPLIWAQQDFWAAENAAGGLMGFDVAITEENIVDAQYNPATHIEGYNRIRDNVAMLAQTLGTPQTQAALPSYAEDNMLAAPATWWSGWAFPDFDGGLILEAGSSYCFDAMNGYEFAIGAMAEQGKTEFTVAVVYFEGDFGGDYRAGALIANAASGVGEIVADIPIDPSAPDVPGAVAQLVAAAPDVIFMGVSPEPLAQIMGGVFQAGHQTAMYVGIGPSWNGVLLALAPDLIPLFEGAYFNTAPWGGWDADTPGHERMRTNADANGRAPDVGYTAGWLFQMIIRAVLAQAIGNGDLTRDGGGLLAAAGQVETVDFEGMIPDGSLVGSPNDIAPRGTVISGIDDEASDGLVAVPGLEYFTGQIAGAYEYSAPCFAG